MIKKSWNLIGQDHFGDICVYIKKKKKTFISKLFLISLHPRSSKDTSGKFQKIWVCLEKAGHAQLKVSDFHLSFVS